MRTALAIAAALAFGAAAALAQPPVIEPPQYMQPGEELVFGCDGYNQYGPGVAAASCTAAAIKRAGPDATCAPASGILSGGCSPSGTLGLQRIVPGARHGCDYQLTITATMANTQIVKCDREIKVRTRVIP